MRIDELKPGVVVVGPMWPEPIHIKTADVRGRYVRLVASTVPSNAHIDQMIPVDDLEGISIRSIETDFAGEAWKVFLALEARRYRLASLYDPLLAMNTSKVDPLPHQIEAVYGHVLKMPVIRFLLAHDPGAGKTIMAGLIIKELKLRGTIRRVLIVVPGHLRDQWRRELKERFEETFVVITREYMDSHYAENVWKKESQMIASIDFAKRDEIIQSLAAAEFDLVVVDEAHKMSAYQYGDKIQKTGRYGLGKTLSKNTNHYLFLTATPHKGDPENFRLFLDLLRPGFFKTADMIQDSINNKDNPLFLRRMKEDMTDFEGQPLFVPRVVRTPDIRLSDPEKELYNEMSVYVKEQYNKALAADKKRNISFALIILQRRFASSIYSLLMSLQRRRARLKDMLEAAGRARIAADAPRSIDFDDVEDMSEDDRWREEALWETLSMAETRGDLEAEISTLDGLIQRSDEIMQEGREAKLAQLKDTLVEMDRDHHDDKILIFTESKDTLTYITKRIEQWGYTVNNIHGGMSLEERVRAEKVFKNETRVMVATEAAGEGINLQFCHLMVNYDLPWNSNRLEQRMGRVHRYGQQKEVTVFNLVAAETREGQVMATLLKKLEEIKSVFDSDKVFDVISEILPGRSLARLMTEAASNTRDQDEILGEIDIDVKDPECLEELKITLGDSLATKYIDYTAIREMRQKALENKLIPEYTQMLFRKAFERAGGKMRDRADGFAAVDSIPHDLRRILDEDGFKKGHGSATRAYPKMTFDKEIGFKNQDAEFVTFGHPLFEAVLEWIDRNLGRELQRGATFFNPGGTDGHVVFHECEIKDGTGATAGRKLFAHFADLESGRMDAIPPTIIWDLEESSGDGAPATDADVDRIKADAEEHVMDSLEGYRAELQAERDHHSEVKEKYGIESLRLSINDLDNDLIDLKNRKAAGEDVDLVIRNKTEKKHQYEEDRDNLKASIKKERNLTMSTPSFMGMIRIRPLAVVAGQSMQNDPDVEAAGMRVAMAHETNAGRVPEDVSKENLGFDVRSSDADGNVRYIEVKARAGEGTVALTTNEYCQASQMGESYYLYVVWNATSPGACPLIFQNPTRALDVKREVVRYFISPEEIREKAQ